MPVDSPKKCLVIQAAGLGHELAGRMCWPQGLSLLSMAPLFPALTCPVQASFRTGLPPIEHGMLANGFYSPVLRKTFFWEQSAAVVRGARIWDRFRLRGGRVGLLFWQQSMGESADLILSPAPIHRHGGGMTEDVYSVPEGLYEALRNRVGRPFRLRQYWGPMASAASSDWIAEAAVELLEMRDDCPELLLVYLPALDYDLQRYGPSHRRTEKALQTLIKEIERMWAAARAMGYEVVVFGDYAIGKATEPVFPSRRLAEVGLFRLRRVGRRTYPDYAMSRAVAVADHEVALVYVARREDIAVVREVLGMLPGVGEIMDYDGGGNDGVNGTPALVLKAAPGFWFAYPWWTDETEAPDYATHVDIHQKPGFDPCELFFGRHPFSISRREDRVRGTHGAARADQGVPLAASLSFEEAPRNVIELGRALGRWLASGAM